MVRYILAAGALVVLAGCAHQLADLAAYDPPGFLSGIWHGMIAPFALIAHLFDSTVRIYAFPNSGGWYDLGFIIGIGGISGAGVRA
ncbi:hypothetical protein ACFOD9_11310 [Novosphingobium bradum]|uniref:Uncharacterized protein n=1 Tax=Novosphingobium bradum TaxID=1737444 RepID=A0ABV7ITD7_9SPHN